MSVPIPQPPTIPFLGNVLAIDKELPLGSFGLLAKQYGEIYQLNLLGRIVYFVNSAELVRELSDDKKFQKIVPGSLNEVRSLAGDGLFTAHADEPNWAIAHRLLMPAFGTANIRNMWDDMKDICSQLILKWSRFGPDYVISPTDDFTRLTLDTIALCSMNYRFNSFYSETLPPFCEAMTDFLKECNARANRPSIVQALMTSTTAKWEADRKLMIDVSSEIVKHRRHHPIEKKDLLNTMLYGRDPKTGQGLDDDAITKNVSGDSSSHVLSGHETTSGLLSFATYHLLKNPECLIRLRKEVDDVTQGNPITLEHLAKMPYLNAVLREAIRLNPTAAVRAVVALEDCVLAGRYSVKKGQGFAINNHEAHHDHKVWGEDADEFKPERMLDGKFEAMPPESWQPFGFGMRACIGRPFAWQEAQLVLASIIQTFDLCFNNPGYTLEIKQALTLKPKDFYIRATLRSDAAHLLSTPSSSLLAPKAAGQPAKAQVEAEADDGTPKPKMYVLYGSNTGTSESFAQRIASDASSHGFKATIGTMDQSTGRVFTDGPVVIITASFEGDPADNAAQAVQWLEQGASDAEFNGLKYAVFGCGNRDWVRTYQRIPTLVDEVLEKKGGTRLLPRGEGDAAGSSFFEDFDAWEAEMWSVLTKEYNTVSKKVEETLTVETTKSGTTRASELRQPDTRLGTVTQNRVLTKPSASGIKRHLEFALPEGVSFRAGDYLAILPVNPPELVKRAIAHFGLSPEEEVTLSSSSPSTLPLNRPINIQSLMSGYVELSQPASTKDLQVLSTLTDDAATKSTLEGLLGDYKASVLTKRISVLDILEAHKDIKVSLSTFLRLLPPMRIRQYSISSSPLADPQHATLTVSIVEGAPVPGHRDVPFLGVASNYLARLQPGERVQLMVKPSGTQFHPPSDLSTPILMFCAGSGLAPMRGFIQERAKQKESGREVGPMYLFFGCRSPEEDYLYSEDDLAEWVKNGVVDVRPAFSRASEKSEGCKYVQDRIWHDREDVMKAYNEGARFYVCGSRKVATGVQKVCIDMLKEAEKLDDEEAHRIWEKVEQERGASDIFE
ncbi:bifunctional P-450/NADPH-P450 reductase [Heliocybe sulcata]|uniref:Bifunctional P-450/NADPH-P450 reductase n=1 Tax=Heliocybe sulcata TaxID=5364 RepID=A0A5C3NG78_9AGAM|nr:bifunctional P-450/NADPH-P450 reductase [Heliocybe sulcata]